MSKAHWILPQGIEEALPEHAVRLETLRRDLLDLYASWGYELVMPPFVDHIESLLTGTGRDLDLQTFKLVDQVSGSLASGVVHPHIEWTIGLERETPLRLVKLHRRNA